MAYHLQKCKDCVPVFLDNNSTYPPLLEWYKECPFRVIRMPQNFGHIVFWANGMHWHEEGYYIVTDPDLEISGLPLDFIDYFKEVLDANPQITKVGSRLKFDDTVEPWCNILPSYYSNATRRDSNSVFQGIDTTLALYRAKEDRTAALYGPAVPGNDFYAGIVIEGNYTIRHLPWYIDHTNLTEEYRYYLEHSARIWNHETLARINAPL